MIGLPVPPRRDHQHGERTTPGPPRILPLSAEAISQIHSSKHITTLQGVVCSLLENSLDAGADKISISVDWMRGSCSVEDNGAGIPSAEFLENGSLGRMHCTSKRSASRQQNDHLHGSTGTFLAELAIMSLLEISSLPERATMSGTLTMHHGKVITRHVKAADTSLFATILQRHGTSVSVRDLFGNMPVRVKQRALSADSGNDHEKAWHELKRDIAALLLAWPRPCSIKVREPDAEAHRVTFNSGSAASLTKRGLGQLEGKSVQHDLRDTLPVIFQASLGPTESRSRWVPLSASTSVVSLRGMICLDPSPHKQCQFIAIGVFPCARNDAHHDLYHAVNSLFANSSFSASEDGPRNAKTSPRPNTVPRQSHGERAQKSLDRHAMYVLQLNFREANRVVDADAAAMSEATMKCLVDILEAAVHAWLESNLFRPRKRRERRDDRFRPSTAAARTAPRTESGPPIRAPSTAQYSARGAGPADLGQDTVKKYGRIIDLSTELHATGHSPDRLSIEEDARHYLTRLRAGPSRNKRHADAVTAKPRSEARDSALRTQPDASEIHGPSPTTSLVSRIRAPPLRVGDLNSKKPVFRAYDSEAPSSDNFGNIDEEELLRAEPACQSQSRHPSPPGESITTWTDPVSGHIFRVNSRTGVVLPTDDNATGSINRDTVNLRHHVAINTSVSSVGKPISLSHRSALAKDRPTTASVTKESWLPGFLREWNNPVFAKKDEESIPTASLFGPGLIEQLEEELRPCAGDKYRETFARHSGQRSGGTTLSRSALHDVEVISQVDQKFILIKMPSRDSERCAEHEADSGSTLVLVDQHAASERIILEELLSEMMGSSTSGNDNQPGVSVRSASLQQNTTRGKSLVFEISAREQELFTQYRAHFQSWGITYNLPAPSLTSSLESRNHKYSGDSLHRLILTHLPTAIAERCSVSPALAIELLRSEIWSFVDGARKPVPPTMPRPVSNNEGANDQPAWISLLPHIPAKMLNMLHSRACRSAIMFNDVLTKEECTVLMKKLATCTFPFVCAHGRVGMVPVMDLGRSGEMEGLSGIAAQATGRALDGGDDGTQTSRGDFVEMNRLKDFMREARRGQRSGTGKDDAEDEDVEMSEASPHKFS
ncbi:DNA mismatch repair protein MLH3 [Cercospora beticola]|uniref:DNA mismatch repair protein MLH3 n=1 Tax=Cercospora beticola TaxID=122368 RepID=A0A2G5HMJ8_CERBT|nr:DNA mismatch repair protein MLH3 [Cercospora beticola]PIA93781.1 DNA mismatch repair protein MLH3 [Cercospora beticola]WPB02113.1 hypothetical protein RHO25_006747 [Cercospora beticola]